MRALLPDLRLPVLVHYGALDLITVPAACRYLAEQIPGARQVVWNNVGHAPFLSRPADSVALWQDFLVITSYSIHYTKLYDVENFTGVNRPDDVVVGSEAEGLQEIER